MALDQNIVFPYTNREKDIRHTRERQRSQLAMMGKMKVAEEGADSFGHAPTVRPAIPGYR